ncbi:MAG: hypothetical protein IJX34_02555 [Clostridia bacterium]|nr:hypothetical protein [Clostridia bacterium]
MNNKNGIFSLWLKNFLCLVFMQSFQAIFMAVIVMVMGVVIQKASSATVTLGDDFSGINGDSGYLICSIIAYAGVTGIIKLEKLIKAIFGIEDSPLLGDLSKSMKKLLITAFNVKDMTRDVKNVMGAKDAAKKDRALKTARVERIRNNMGKIDSLAAAASKPNNTTNNTTVNLGSGASNGYNRNDIAALFNDSSNFDKDGKLIERTPAQQMLYDAQKEQMDAEREYQTAKSKLAVRTLSTIAGAGIANGAFDDMDEVAMVANKLADGFSYVGDKTVGKAYANNAIRKKTASQLKANDKALNEIKEEFKGAKSEYLNTIRKNQEEAFNTMNDAIIESTKKVSTGAKIPKNTAEIRKAADKAKTSIQNAADDWLNTQFTTPKANRVTNRESKRIINEHRNKDK